MEEKRTEVTENEELLKKKLIFMNCQTAILFVRNVKMIALVAALL